MIVILINILIHNEEGRLRLHFQSVPILYSMTDNVS